jgi:hypothetical protein
MLHSSHVSVFQCISQLILYRCFSTITNKYHLFMDSTALKIANAVEAEAVISGRRCSRSHYQVNLEQEQFSWNSMLLTIIHNFVYIYMYIYVCTYIDIFMYTIYRLFIHLYMSILYWYVMYHYLPLTISIY